MVEPLLLAFIIALIMKLDIKKVFRRWEFYPLLAMTLVYIVFQVTIFMDNYYFIRFTPHLKTGYLVSLAIIIFRNGLYNSYMLAAAAVVYIGGSLMNRFVVSANGGKMPVFPSLSLTTGYVDSGIFTHSNLHILGNETTKYKWLTDIYDVGYSVMSLGDILMLISVFLILVLYVSRVNKKTGVAV